MSQLICVCVLSAGFQGNSSFCLGEEEEVEIELQEDFLSFDADLVAEQLTYMDAVSLRKQSGDRAYFGMCVMLEGYVTKVIFLLSFFQCSNVNVGLFFCSSSCLKRWYRTTAWALSGLRGIRSTTSTAPQLFVPLSHSLTLWQPAWSAQC